MSSCKFCDAEIEWIDRVPHNLDHSRHTCQRKQKTPPEPRDCKFECKTLLLWDDNREGFREVNTGELHTKERCQEAKAKLEQKNNHGNETYSPITAMSKEAKELDNDTMISKPYVDHTQQAKGQQRFRAFSMPTADQLTKLIDDWIDENEDFIQIRMIGQLQLSADGKTFAIAVYYEESK